MHNNYWHRHCKETSRRCAKEIVGILNINLKKTKPMKTNNPSSRYDLAIKRNDIVLEVGGGHNPHPKSQIVVDKYIDSNYHRHADIKVLNHQQLLQADGEHLPFGDKSFDYCICNQVLEHADNPGAFLREQSRVAKRGYIETPSLIGEYLFPKQAHKWLVLELDNKLVLVEKEKYWFKTNIDLGFLFLTWLQKTSVGYKILMDTKPNFMTVRYEWKDEIEFVVNPEDERITRFFNGYWDEEMVSLFFPARTRAAELADAVRALLTIIWRGLFRT